MPEAVICRSLSGGGHAYGRRLTCAGTRSEGIERPLFRAFGLSRADAQQKSLGRKAVGANAFFKLPGRTEPPRRTGILQHGAQRSLLTPLSKCVEHSHPPRIDGKNLIRGVAN